MFKKLIMSGLVLGALAATVGAGSYAAFTDSGTATGTVSAATVDILLNGVDNPTVTFTPATNIIPGGSSSTIVTVFNNGSVPVDVNQFGAILITETNDPGGDCDTAALTSAVPTGLPILALAPAASAPFTITFTLSNAAGNECQGNAWSVAATVQATT